MKPELFNARDVLREVFEERNRVPFTPIQAFGLPFDEYRIERPLDGMTAASRGVRSGR